MENSMWLDHCVTEIAGLLAGGTAEDHGGRKERCPENVGGAPSDSWFTFTWLSEDGEIGQT